MAISATPQPANLARGVIGAAMARKPVAHGQNVFSPPTGGEQQRAGARIQRGFDHA